VSDKSLSLIIIATEGKVPKQLDAPFHSPVQLSVSYRTHDIAKGMKKIKELKPNVVLVELSQVEEERVAFLLKLRLSHPESKILVIAEKFSLDEWLQYLKTGARAILVSDYTARDLSNAIWIVNQGGIYLDSERMNQFVEQCAAKVRQAEEKAGDLLTDREIQVLRLLAEGYTVKKAASLLELSPKTVDTHKANLMRKVNIHHRADLIKYALRKKIITLQEE
jgi:two-component system response regulator NreC